MRGAKILADTLASSDVEYAFGLAGSAILGVLDDIAKSDVSFVTTRHEQVATGMATGYALATRRPTVSISHVGPGAANQILGMAAAYRDDIPVVAITGNEPSDRLGMNVRHEWDVMEIFERITKHNVRVTRDRPHEQVRNALLRSVTGVPGPVHIDFPRDLEEADLPEPDERSQRWLREKDLHASRTRSRPPMSAVERTVDLLAEAEQPLLIVGSEARWSDGSADLKRLAETLEIPVATTKNARGALSESNPLSLGLVGRPGMDPTNEYLRDADLVIGVGTRFSDITTLNWELVAQDADVVHVTMREESLDRYYLSTVSALADSASFLADLNDAVAERGTPMTFADVAVPARASYEETRDRFFDPERRPAEEGVDPRKLVMAIDKAVGDYAFTTGGGVHTDFPRRVPVDDLNGTFVTANFAGMSQGFPLAMGAQLAMDRQVFAFEGDGGFTMVMQDLETAVREEIPVKVVILNNESFMSQRARQKRYYGERYTGSVFSNPNFAAVAEEYGMFGEQVTDDDQIPGAVDRLLAADGPGLLDVHIDPWLGTDGYDRD